MLSKQSNWQAKATVILVLGGFSILGTYMGVRLPSDAIVNVRDMGPIVAGFIGGPIVGLGAGLIGGIHRYSLGGFTALPCALATVLVGLISGYIHRMNGNRLPKVWIGLLFAALLECLHMGLVLLIARPFPEALMVVRTAVFPMVLANAVGVGISLLFINEWTGQNRLWIEKIGGRTGGES